MGIRYSVFRFTLDRRAVLYFESYQQLYSILHLVQLQLHYYYINAFQAIPACLNTITLEFPRMHAILAATLS